ncbi:MAG: hypothetical protein ABIH72_04405 [archaeon]
MDSTVKIDSELKARAEALIKEKKFDYPNLKNFVDKAVLMMLEKEDIKNKNENKLKEKKRKK